MYNVICDHCFSVEFVLLQHVAIKTCLQLSEGPAAAMETDALLLQVRGCRTVCQLIWDKRTLTLNSLNGS